MINFEENELEKYIHTGYTGKKFKSTGYDIKSFGSKGTRSYFPEKTNLKYYEVYIDFKNSINQNVLICKTNNNKIKTIIKNIFRKNFKNVTVENKNTIFYNPLNGIKNEEDMKELSILFIKTSLVEYDNIKYANLKNIVSELFIYAYKNNKIENMTIMLEYLIQLFEDKYTLKVEIKDILKNYVDYNKNDIELVYEILHNEYIQYKEKRLKNKIKINNTNHNVFCFYYKNNFILNAYINEFMKKNNMHDFIYSKKCYEDVLYYDAYYLCCKNKEKVINKIQNEYKMLMEDPYLFRHRRGSKYSKNKFHCICMDKNNDLILPKDSICEIIKLLKKESKEKLDFINIK